MKQLYVNNFASALVGEIAAGDGILTVASSTGLPTPADGDFFLLTLVGLDANGNEALWEIVKVTSRAGNTLTVVRDQEGTGAHLWPDGTVLEARLTAGGMNRKLDTNANAVSASKLDTARTINGVSFDGTADIIVQDSTKLSLSGGRVTGAIGAFQGANGGYGSGNGGSNAWGACIWGMGEQYDGSGVNDSYTPSSHYGISWLRGAHGSFDAQIGEGAYVYQAGVLKGGIGSFGIKTLGTFYGSGAGITSLNASNIAAGTLPDARISDTGNLAPSLVNSFTFGGIPLRYRRVGGICYISGQVNRSALPAPGATIFTLPAGYRPSAGYQCLGELYGAGNGQRVPYRFAVNTAGVVQASWSAGEPTTGVAPTGTLSFTLNFAFPVA